MKQQHDPARCECPPTVGPIAARTDDSQFWKTYLEHQPVDGIHYVVGRDGGVVAWANSQKASAPVHNVFRQSLKSPAMSVGRLAPCKNR